MVVSHGGYHTGIAGLEPEKAVLETANVQCPRGGRDGASQASLRVPPSPIYQCMALQHPREALEGKSTRKLGWAGRKAHRRK